MKHRKYVVYMIINKKNCRESFEKIILHQFDTQEKMLSKERELVNEEFIKRDDTYNIILGGNNLLTTGTVTVKDKSGNCFNVHKEDPRYLNGELVGIGKGKAITKDKYGNRIQVDKNDPRWLTGEFVGVTKGKITVKDKDGNYFCVDKNDLRYLSGELIPLWKGKKHTQEFKEKISKASKIHQRGSGNSQFGTCWITNETENKKIKRGDMIPDGWRLGRTIKSK